MKVDIQKCEEQGECYWLVCTCGISARFGSEHDAIEYAEKLNARVNAPHEWPSGGSTEMVQAEVAEA